MAQVEGMKGEAMTTETRYLVNNGRDIRAARELLRREGIAYREETWQAGITAVYVPADADVSNVFEGRVS